VHRWRHKAWLVALMLAATPAAAAEKRRLPDYDGRGPKPVTVGDVLIWVPRVLLAPPYLVSEYVIRRPLGAAIAGAERAGWPGALYDFFTFGPDHNAGFAPTLFVDFGFRPSVGLFTFWNDAGARGHDLRLQVGFWGWDWLAASFSDRLYFSCDPADLVRLDVSVLRRPDYAFFGLGPSSRQTDITRYGSDRFEVRVSADQRWWRRSAVHAAITAREVEFHRGWFGNDVPLDDAIARGAVPPPPGYPGGYTMLKSELTLSLDNRSPDRAPGSGVRLEMRGSHSADPRGHGGWVGYGGVGRVFLDVSGMSRVVSLSAGVHFVDPLGSEDIPFTELATLGGFGPMRGFYPGRLVGRSAAVAELAYRWPIWIWLDGSLRFEVGNVFGDHMRDFDAGLLRLSSAIGVESSGIADNPLEVLVGFGSETFDSGAKIDSFRLFVGTHRGF
jgi:surface antigen Omp85-like protein